MDAAGNGDLLHFHESLAADADRLPVDLDGDSVTDLVLRVVGGGETQFELLSPVEDGQGDRMVELPLGGRREAGGPGRE